MPRARHTGPRLACAPRGYGVGGVILIRADRLPALALATVTRCRSPRRHRRGCRCRAGWRAPMSTPNGRGWVAPRWSTMRTLYGALPWTGRPSRRRRRGRTAGRRPRSSKPGYQPLLSVNDLTADCAPKELQASPVKSAFVWHSWNGYVPTRLNATFDDCGRDGRFFSVVGSRAAFAPLRRNGSKWLSTSSRPPLAPSLGSDVRLLSTWLTLPYPVSRYQTRAPGALYLIFSTFQAPSSPSFW